MSPPSQLSRILAFRLNTADPERLIKFYRDGIGFSVGDRVAISPSEMAVLGLVGGGERTSLILGSQRLDLDRFGQQGRPYPPTALANDLRFQHFAIVTTNAQLDYDRALQNGAMPISTNGPVELPASTGGVIAVKFRDPEGHPLEFLEIPQAIASPWHALAKTRSGALGIDHSAISISDTATSISFYEAHGLRLGGRTLNHGPTQAALDGLPDPEVDVITLMPPNPAPHFELLGYRTPQARSVEMNRLNDIAATRVVWASDHNRLLRDPDGHQHQLEAVDGILNP